MFLKMSVVLGIYAVLIGCGGPDRPSGPTAERVAVALTEVFGASDFVSVVGVAEEGNSARADLQFKDAPLKDEVYPPPYTGRGAAILTRYNDGRWVLTRVMWGRLMSTYREANVPLK